MNKTKVYSLFSEMDVHLFREGKHYSLYEKMGSHPVELDGESGVYFAVWAPNAKSVGLIGDFNYWQKSGDYELYLRWDGSGIWEGFVPALTAGEIYKYAIETQNGQILEKADLYAFAWQKPPHTATKVQTLDYNWADEKWMKNRAIYNALNAPVSVYEVHLGSWRQGGNGPEDFLTYRDMMAQLVPYVQEMGYTHVEFLPVMEHPFYGSWGYQVLGYYAPTSRYGSPQDFMALVEAFHNAGIGVLLDWVPSHFPGDAHGIKDYDGSALYEHADPRQGYHPDWSSYIFNYGRNEVRSFLISNALFWFDKYHVDGLRVDAVASMLYLDYSRKEGEWVPNKLGGRENLEAITFLKELNEAVYNKFPDVQTIAEESTSFPMVSRPTYIGGLGFGMKWMMGWMNDTLEYFKKDPIHRKFHHNTISFSLTYAFTENFMLPLSHDEVVHGKGSILNRMPGDDWQKMANTRLLYGFMFAHPGTKLNFMGNEIGQWQEWNHRYSLDWHVLDNELNKGMQRWTKALNKLYREQKPLYEIAFHVDGFEWVDYNDHNNSVLCFLRKDKAGNALLVVCNFTPVVHENYRVGVPFKLSCNEILNSDATTFGGSGVENNKTIKIEPIPSHGKPQSIAITLPPLGIIVISSQ
ncbi:1,4-alpha-glucan branching protein GlgB [bacterium]|nr:1,4-alpha-glucan branching protein GlgB [bacterium]